jgi:hypothetical protein
VRELEAPTRLGIKESLFIHNYQSLNVGNMGERRGLVLVKARFLSCSLTGNGNEMVDGKGGSSVSRSRVQDSRRRQQVTVSYSGSLYFRFTLYIVSVYNLVILYNLNVYQIT